MDTGGEREQCAEAVTDGLVEVAARLAAIIERVEILRITENTTRKQEVVLGRGTLSTSKSLAEIEKTPATDNEVTTDSMAELKDAPLESTPPHEEAPEPANDTLSTDEIMAAHSETFATKLLPKEFIERTSSDEAAYRIEIADDHRIILDSGETVKFRNLRDGSAPIAFLNRLLISTEPFSVAQLTSELGTAGVSFGKTDEITVAHKIYVFLKSNQSLLEQFVDVSKMGRQRSLSLKPDLTIADVRAQTDNALAPSSTIRAAKPTRKSSKTRPTRSATFNHFDPFRDRDTSVLSKEAERDLLERWQRDHDESARDELVTHNIGLVRLGARRLMAYRDAHGATSLGFDDLVQAGQFGLLKALDDFDLSRDVRLSTYAVPWIGQKIKREIHDKGAGIRRPVNFEEKDDILARATGELLAKHGRQPTVQELSEATDMSCDSIQKHIRLANQSRVDISLDAPIDSSDSRTSEIGAFVPDPADDFGKADQQLDSEAVRKLFDKSRRNGRLSKKEHLVLKLRFGIGPENGAPMTLEEIGAMLGVSRERVRQIQEKALRKLRNSPEWREVSKAMSSNI